MDEINWMTVIVSITLSTITACTITKYTISSFLKKLSYIDEQYKEKLINIVVDTVSKRIHKVR